MPLLPPGQSESMMLYQTARRAGWRRPLIFGVSDFPKRLVGVLDR
jgi:hypothetical protein